MLIDNIELTNDFKEFNMVQGSDEWFSVKLGIISSSKMDILMPSSKQTINDFNKSQKTILAELAVQRMTGLMEETFKSKDMENGNELEPEARSEYELKTMQIVEEVGFIKSCEYFGDSPDGFTRDKVQEFKCPKSTTHFDYYQNPKLLIKKYKWQGVCHIYHKKKLSCDFVSYHPRFPKDKKLVVANMERSEEDIKYMLKRVEICNKYIEGLIDG